MPPTERVLGSVQTASPVIKRLARDDSFQEHLKKALDSARRVYNELPTESGPKAITGRLVSDKSLQQDLGRTIESLREARKRLAKASEPSHKARNALLVGGIAMCTLYGWSRYRALGAGGSAPDRDHSMIP